MELSVKGLNAAPSIMTLSNRLKRKTQHIYTTLSIMKLSVKSLNLAPSIMTLSTWV